MAETFRLLPTYSLLVLGRATFFRLTRDPEEVYDSFLSVEGRVLLSPILRLSLLPEDSRSIAHANAP